MRKIGLILYLLWFQFSHGQPPAGVKFYAGIELSGFSFRYNVPAAGAGYEKLSLYYPRLGLQKARIYISGVAHFGTYKSSAQNLKQKVKGFGGSARYYLVNWKANDSASFFWKIRNLSFIPVFVELNYLRTNYDIDATAFRILPSFEKYVITSRLGFHVRLYKFLYLTTGIGVLIANNYTRKATGKVGSLLSFDFIL